jgi:hypothetical protein
MQSAEYMRTYLLLPFKIGMNIIILMIGVSVIVIIMFIGKWIFPIMNRKISSLDDLKNKRSASRQQHHEPIIITTNEEFKIESTFTINVSTSGCLAPFKIGMNITKHARKIGDILWI